MVAITTVAVFCVLRSMLPQALLSNNILILNIQAEQLAAALIGPGDEAYIGQGS